MIEKLDKFLEKSSYGVLVASLFLMLTLTLINIIARQFDRTFMWIDPLVRHLVFLSAFMGGVLATGKGNHIKIDLASRLLESMGKQKQKRWLDAFISLGSFVACFFLVKAGMDFAKIEFEFGREAFLGIHSGWLTAIIPYGFALIGLRFITRLLIGLK